MAIQVQEGAERGLMSTLRALARGGALSQSALDRSARFVMAPDLRIDLAWPRGPAPQEGFPLMVVTDGNAMFATLVEAARREAQRPDLTGPQEPVILGIGHDTGELFDTRLRERDYTPPGSAFMLQRLAMLMDDLAAHLPLSRGRRVLIGHSFGGLFALQALFSRPDLFSAYVASSPSIWRDRDGIREGIAALPERLAALHEPVRLLVSVGGEERGHPLHGPWGGTDRAHRLGERRVLEEAEALAGQLAALSPARLTVAFRIFEGESHGSVIPGALGRAARFACEGWS